MYERQSTGTAPKHRTAGSRLGRRALLATAGLGACAVGAGVIVTKGGDVVQTEVGQALRNEVGTLEGVGLDEAIRAAQLTRQAVQVIVLPVARLVSTLGAGGLQVLIDAVARAQQVLAVFGITISALASLQQVLQSWQADYTAMPIALSAYTTADITSAETYLKALKAKANPSQTVS